MKTNNNNHPKLIPIINENDDDKKSNNKNKLFKILEFDNGYKNTFVLLEDVNDNIYIDMVKKNHNILNLSVGDHIIFA